MVRILFFCLLYSVSALGYCPPTSPVLPPPKIETILSLPNLTKSLDALRQGNENFNASLTSFSLAITSSNSKFYEYYHTASLRNNSGVQAVDENTVYRVASNTKVFMTLAMLLSVASDIDKPIGNYIPELRGDSRYDELTMRLLASHLAGVPRDGNAFDHFTSDGQQLQQLGFPVPAPSDIPGCDLGPGSASCTRAKFFSILTGNNLTNLPGNRAGYSDLAYTLLGFALENITGKAFQDIVKDKITTPLGLNSTSFDTPDPSRTILPVGIAVDFLNLDISHYKPAAGLYSTPADLLAFLRAILSNDLLPRVKTRQWLKPMTFTSSLQHAVGMPWEIFRSISATVDRRPIDLYTKSGDFGGWASWSVIIPEYQVAAIINAAGDQAYHATVSVLNTLITDLLPSLEAEARRQASDRFGGTYVSRDGSNDSITLVVDDGPGLKIQEWKTKSGESVFDGLALIKGVRNFLDVEARAYPIGEGGRWRVGIGTSETGFVETSCLDWMKVDQYRYAGQPLDEIDFILEGDGSVVGVDCLGLRSSLEKEKE